MSRLYVVAALVALLPTPLSACECIPPTTAEAFDQADFVFIGTPLPGSEHWAWPPPAVDGPANPRLHPTLGSSTLQS